MYSWLEVKESVNRILSMKFNSKDPVFEMYGNNLPNALNQALVFAMVYELSRCSHDVKVILNAYHQLETKGYIGHESARDL